MSERFLGLFKSHRAPVTKAVPVNNGLKTEPISLGDGVIGQVKSFCLHPESATQDQHDTLYAQLCGLARNASGLEDDFALYADRRMIKRAKRSLEKRLSDETALASLPEEQILDYARRLYICC